MTRTRLGLTVAVTVLLVLAGCAAGPQNRRVTGSGNPATLSPATLDEAGVSQERATTEALQTQVETTVTGDVSVQAVVDVDVTTPIREYRGDGVTVGVVSTPAVQPIEGRGPFRDPLAELTPAAQVAHAQSRYRVAELDERERARNVTLLGRETPLRRFDARAEDEPVTVFLIRARDGDDFVTVVVIASAGHEVDVAGLVSGVEH